MTAQLLTWSFNATPDAAAQPRGIPFPLRTGRGTAAELRAAVFAEAPGAVLLLDASPEDVLAIRTLRTPLVWDLADLSAEDAERLRTDEAWRSAFAQAVARVDAVANAGTALRTAAEDALCVGLPSLGMAEAMAQLDRPVAIAVGSGLGNMLNATPMIRWIAARTGRRVTVVIHGNLAQGVQLFAGAPWVDFVFPGFEYATGRHYHVLVQTALAAHMEPLCTADRWIQQHKVEDFNLHGRFVREADVFFLGLEEAFGPAPLPGDPLPAPFVRDLVAAPEHERVIGLANGIKQGIWAKRQWDKTAALAERLSAEGWTLRCFGMPEELVPHAEDFTGLSIRDTAAEIARCAYFIGHDGGMCHLAEKVGVPTLWLFGPTGRIKNGRWFEQSEMLTSDAACSPCNFKLDWLRCNTPACMEDISVEDTLAGFARVREKTARLGRTMIWAGVDQADIAQEIRSADLPGRPPGDLREAAERIVAIPPEAGITTRLLANALRSGDIRGAASLAAAADRLCPPEGSVQEFGAAVRVLFDPRSGGPVLQNPGLTLETLVALQLAPGELRAGVEAIAHALIAVGRAREVPELFERMSRRVAGSLGNWSQRRWIRTLMALTPEQIARRSAELLFTCRSSREMIELLRRCSQEASILAESAALRGAGPIETPLAPGRLGLPGLGSPAIRLDLPGGPVELPRWSTVALLTPTLDPSNLRPGSAAGLVMWIARALAALGLCPVVANWTQCSDRSTFELRNNVNFIHGYRNWSPTTWRTLVRATAPRLIIGFDGAETAMGLEEGALSFGLQGLYDREGLAEVIGEEMSIDLPRKDGATATPADRLVTALPMAAKVPPPRPAAGSQGTVGLLLNDYRDLGFALHLVRRCPDLHFLLVGDVADRGLEPNVTFLLRRRVTEWSEVSERIGCLMQLASRPGNLSAEALNALCHGRPVVAAALDGGASLASLAGRLVTPDDPGRPESWISALRAIQRDFAPRAEIAAVA